MSEGIQTVVVAGDISLDWLYLELPPQDEAPGSGKLSNWKLKPGMKRVWCQGGALLLADMLRAATDAEVLSRQIPDLETKSIDEVLHSIVELKLFPYSEAEEKKKKKEERYRAANLRGFVRPRDLHSPREPFEGDDPRAGLVVLDDAAADFRKHPGAWPKALENPGTDQYALLKMNRPLAEGELWEPLWGTPGDGGQCQRSSRPWPSNQPPAVLGTDRDGSRPASEARWLAGPRRARPTRRSVRD